MNNINKFYKSSAFTLAEVLIVIGMIGIIASLTIPSLVSNVNNIGTATKVKKYQAILSQAVRRYMIDNNCSESLSACKIFDGDDQHSNVWEKVFKPYLNIAKECGLGPGCFPADVAYKYLNNTSSLIALNNLTNRYNFMFTDGSSGSMRDFPGNCASSSDSISGTGVLSKACGVITVDVNGFNPPNQFGRDTFQWRILDSGIYPVGIDDDRYFGCSPSSSDLLPDADGAPAQGIGCTKLIIEKGNIDY